MGLTSLRERLETRRPEIQQTILARVYSISDPAEDGDAEYVAGLRAAVSIALDYGLTDIEGRQERDISIPTELLNQARQAARNSVSLDTVLRRYFAGYTLLSDFILRGAEEAGSISAVELQDALRFVSTQFDRLVITVTDEYRRETEKRLRSPEKRHADRVRRMLAGEPLNMTGLDYDLAGWHLGVAGAGPDVSKVLRDLATALDRRLFLVRPDEEQVWAWLGGRQKVSAAEALVLTRDALPAEVFLALGEPRAGPEGWRVTHRQAMAALPLARRSAESVVRYADVALLATVLRDEVLIDSLHRIFLSPLAHGNDDGAVLRETLRAYFAAGRNTSSAASALGVSRQTVGSRLRVTEERLGSALDTCATQIEMALRLESLGDLSIQPIS